ncbi:hypothetical protein, partial [Bacteroides heparinolyticus]|uniref:hypothetical protein n=1 Tax=Prevotella heparinolytica TaxID=28113 RepID=UPI0035A15168
GNEGILAVRTDRNLNIIWERILGCEEHFFPHEVYGVATDDGGIVCTTSRPCRFIAGSSSRIQVTNATFCVCMVK